MTNNKNNNKNKTEQNSKCRLCVDGDKMLNHIISQFSKLAQEYNTWHDWVGKVIHWELCKKLKFDYTNKRYMDNPASVLENDTQNPMRVWHTNGSPNLSQTTIPNDSQQQKKKKENFPNCGFAVPANHSVELKVNKKRYKYLNLSWKLKKKKKKTIEHECDCDTNCNWCTRYTNQRIGIRIGELKNKRASGYHRKYSIVEIGQNTEKSPGDLGRLTVSQTPVKNQLLTLVWKTPKSVKRIVNFHTFI